MLQSYPHTVAAISNNNNPHDLFAYCHGRTVVLRTPGQQTPPREINFVNNLTAICIRPDGAVFASADETGEIEVMDTKEKFHLRTFKNHKKRVNAIEYV